MPTGGSPALGVLSGQCMELSQQWGRLESSGMSPLLVKNTNKWFSAPSSWDPEVLPPPGELAEGSQEGAPGPQREPGDFWEGGGQ